MIIIQQPEAEIRFDFDDKQTRGTLFCTKQGLGFKIPNVFDILQNIPGFLEVVNGPNQENQEQVRT